MKKGILVLTVALSLTLSSCGLYSKYDKATEVDANLYGAVTGATIVDDSLSLGNLTWREVFTDTELLGLIEMGLENNSDLQKALLNVESAKASLTAARLAYLPSVALTAEGSSAGLISGTTAESYTVAGAVSWEIDIFGKLTNQKLQSKSIFEQQVYIAQGVRSQVVATIAQLYYSLAMLDEQIAISTATEKSWAESVETAKALKSAGMMNEAGVAQLEASYLSVKNSVITLKSAREQNQNALCGLLMMTPQPISTLPLEDVSLAGEISLGVPMMMLSARPDVMAAESALAASFYSRNVARSSFYPSITLTGAAGWANALGTIVLDPAEAIFSVVGDLVQPIFTRGLNRAQLVAAKAQLEQSRLTFEQTLLNSGIEVNDALITLMSSIEMSSNYSSQVERLSVAAESTALMMKHGSTTYLEVLTAQQTLYNAELQQVSNRFDQLQGLITLYSSLGGGRF